MRLVSADDARQALDHLLALEGGIEELQSGDLQGARDAFRTLSECWADVRAVLGAECPLLRASGWTAEFRAVLGVDFDTCLMTASPPAVSRPSLGVPDSRLYQGQLYDARLRPLHDSRLLPFSSGRPASSSSSTDALAAVRARLGRACSAARSALEPLTSVPTEAEIDEAERALKVIDAVETALRSLVAPGAENGELWEFQDPLKTLQELCSTLPRILFVDASHPPEWISTPFNLSRAAFNNCTLAFRAARNQNSRQPVREFLDTLQRDVGAACLVIRGRLQVFLPQPEPKPEPEPEPPPSDPVVEVTSKPDEYWRDRCKRLDLQRGRNASLFKGLDYPAFPIDWSDCSHRLRSHAPATPNYTHELQSAENSLNGTAAMTSLASFPGPAGHLRLYYDRVHDAFYIWYDRSNDLPISVLSSVLNLIEVDGNIELTPVTFSTNHPPFPAVRLYPHRVYSGPVSPTAASGFSVSRREEADGVVRRIQVSNRKSWRRSDIKGLLVAFEAPKTSFRVVSDPLKGLLIQADLEGGQYHDSPWPEAHLGPASPFDDAAVRLHNDPFYLELLIHSLLQRLSGRSGVVSEVEIRPSAPPKVRQNGLCLDDFVLALRANDKRFAYLTGGKKTPLSLKVIGPLGGGKRLQYELSFDGSDLPLVDRVVRSLDSVEF